MSKPLYTLAPPSLAVCAKIAHTELLSTRKTLEAQKGRDAHREGLADGPGAVFIPRYNTLFTFS